MLNSGQFSRRRLLQSVAALSLIKAVPFAVAAHAQETPVHGGVLAEQVNRDPVNFDIFANQSSIELRLLGPCYNGLLQFDPMDPAKIIGDLATDWTVSEDGTVYDFTLKQGVLFHDGMPFTAADVKATFDYIRNPPEGQVSVRRSIFSGIADITVEGDHAVRFVLAGPSASFLNNLAFGHVLIAPKHILDRKGNMKEDVIGTGPFRFKEAITGNYAEIERNPNYHVPDRPYLDGIRYYVVPDPVTALNYLRSGQLDYFEGIGPKEAEIIERDFPDQARVLVAPGPASSQVMKINTARAPFDDIRVRQAVALAIDHSEAVRVGAAVRASDAGGLMAAGGQWSLPQEKLTQIAGFGPDIEARRAEAKALLAEAGHPNGFNTTVLTRRGSDSNETNALFTADQLAKIGIRAELVPQETATFVERLTKSDFDMAADSFESTTDPDRVFADSFLCEGSRNNIGICVPEIDELIAKQSVTLDPDARKSLVNELEALVLQQYAVIPIFHVRSRFAINNRVQNLISFPEDDNNRRMESVWLSA